MPGVTSNPLLTKEHQCLDLSHLPNLIGLVPFHTHLDVKSKNVEQDHKNKGTKMKIFKISIVSKCNKYQGYGHIAINCISYVKFVIINRVSIVSPESESTSSSGITLVIKEFSVVFWATVVVVLTAAATTIAHPFCRLHYLLLPSFLLLL